MDKSHAFEVWLHKRFREPYVIDWDRKMAIGPLSTHTVLRRFREANTWVANGCDRGEWTWQFKKMQPRRLPSSRIEDWTRMDSASLPPSATLHHWHASTANPLIDWSITTPDEISSKEMDELLKAVGYPKKFTDSKVGRMKRSWNAHPKGSLVITASLAPKARLVVIEF